MSADNSSSSSGESGTSLSGEWTDPQWVGPQPAAFGRLAEEDVVGRCKIVRELGMGGMGAVYLATHTTLQIDVALKILPPVFVRERAETAQRFIREAQLAARIRHPNVVSVMDADFDQSTGLYYIVLEYVSGGSLAERLRKGQLSEAESVRIILDIAQALVVASEHKIVHRDIKPDNIMLDGRGNAKLADLGLAKQDFVAVNNTQLTQTGASVGTPSYMSPDQINNAQNADAQDDIYSLGATLYECLTGTPPFAAANPYNAVGKILFSPTPDPRSVRSDISPGLSAICQKMMAKKKSDRYSDAAALIDDLQAYKNSPAGKFVPKKGKKRSSPSSVKNQDWFYDQVVNPRRKIRIIDLFLFGIVLALTVWVVRAMLLNDDSKTTPAAPQGVAAAAPETAPAPEPQPVAPDNTAHAPRALPVEETPPPSMPTPATPLALESQSSPVALPPPEPMPGEETPPPATTEPVVSAFQARTLAEQMVPETVRANLMQINGPRRPGTLTPSYWRFLYWDPTAKQNVRAVTVTGDVAAPAKEGFVELGKLRVISYKQSEVIDVARLQIDSSKALELVQATPELKGVTVSSAAYFLDKGKGNFPPVWRLTLFAHRNNEEVQLGEVRVSAETGLILEFGIKLNRLPAQP